MSCCSCTLFLNHSRSTLAIIYIWVQNYAQVQYVGLGALSADEENWKHEVDDYLPPASWSGICHIEVERS